MSWWFTVHNLFQWIAILFFLVSLFYPPFLIAAMILLFLASLFALAFEPDTAILPIIFLGILYFSQSGTGYTLLVVLAIAIMALTYNGYRHKY